MKVALLIEYDGTDFAGWQSQRGVRTVQTELEGAFRKIFDQELVVHGAGRTDTGVHARGMVAHVILETPVDLYKLTAGLNATTGRDVVIQELRQTDDDFHARHSALSREYAYTILRGRTALNRKTEWATHYELDTERMFTAAAMLVGEHDFTSFSKRSEHVDHYRCIVTRSEFLVDGPKLVFWIRANRFVRGMVRGIMGALVEVGRGNTTLDEFASLLALADPLARAKYLAPARGLILEKVRYPERFGLW